MNNNNIKLSKKLVTELLQKPFCIINKKDMIQIHIGEITFHSQISELPPLTHSGTNYISLLPYCQIKEKGFATHDEGEPIITLYINESCQAEITAFLDCIDDLPLTLTQELSSDFTDQEYEQAVTDIIEHEIKCGEGANFLLSRKFRGQIKDFSLSDALSILKNLIVNERNSYWNFLFFTGETFFIGASPERHLCINGSQTIMNPISGTIPKHTGAGFSEELAAFVTDPKEVHELFQVVDEELKLICKLCPEGGKVIGPFLKEMDTLIHTEYLLEGEGVTNIWKALRSSIYAATMIGSPLENAARIVKKYEQQSRRYYSSVICSFGLDQNHQPAMDNAITIRTMEMDLNGNFVIQSGNTIVRDSDPASETKELKAKVQGLLNAIVNQNKAPSIPVTYTTDILDRLQQRNQFLSNFWLAQHETIEKCFSGIIIDLIDNDDDFIYMLGHMLHCMGAQTRIYKYDEYQYRDDANIVLIGPGPGDPNNQQDQKIATLSAIANTLLKEHVKVIGICLGHQILLKALGFPLKREAIPFQGIQKEINLFGELHNVGFYNSYFAIDENVSTLELSKSNDHKIYAAKGEGHISFQFHVESILTQHGMAILRQAVAHLLTAPKRSHNLQAVRDQIDTIDRNIIELLQQRGLCVKEASQFKHSLTEVKADDRVQDVINKVTAHALEVGVSTDLVKHLYELIIGSFIKLETKEFDRHQQSKNR